MRRFLIYLFALLFPLSAVAAPEVSEFAQSAAWLKLLHYNKSFGGYKGLIKSEKFYLAADGRVNPEAELKKDIEAFQNGDKKMRVSGTF